VTDPPAGTPAVDEAGPWISGTDTVGSTLTEVHGDWSNSPTGYRVEWADCSGASSCTVIPDATGQTYTLTSADVGYEIEALELPEGGEGGAQASSALTAPITPPPPVNIAPPTISEQQPISGQTLTEAHGSWSGTVTGYKYQWEQCNGSGEDCTLLASTNPTTQSIVVPGLAVGYSLRVSEIAEDGAALSAPAVSTETYLVSLTGNIYPPEYSVAPEVFGSPTVGSTLYGYKGIWSGPQPITYGGFWQLCGEFCTTVPGTDTTTLPAVPQLKVTKGMIGLKATFNVAAVNAAGDTYAASPETAAITARPAPAPAPAPPRQPRVTAAKFSGIGRGRPRLAITALATTADPVTAVTITLPSGLRFSRATKALKRGLVVRGSSPAACSGERLSSATFRLVAGSLRITVHGSCQISVVLSPAAMSATPALTRAVAKGHVRRLLVTIRLLTRNRRTTTLRLSLRP